ncbi:hypothetical protein L6452_36362 [Arctium lappa]|uniref:Uncharacterized protein n=1 Tax=Arctium lappa TaxID=4217 RepID=A0ACB8YAG3_ARCLA|nr:hypothetical protein L6452_36362 [Arctium lappa]
MITTSSGSNEIKPKVGWAYHNYIVDDSNNIHEQAGNREEDEGTESVIKPVKNISTEKEVAYYKAKYHEAIGKGKKARGFIAEKVD